MRVTIFLFVLFASPTIFSQKFQVRFNQCFQFKKGKSFNYESLIEKGGFQLDQIQNGQNMYVFDLTNREALLYFRGKLVRRGVRDILFEVSQKKDVVYSALLLKLSVIEQLHQEGELICQLDEFCKWSDLIVNW
jgi:hypothetical protein